MPYEGAGLLISYTSSTFPELDVMGLMQNTLLVSRVAPSQAPAGIGTKWSQCWEKAQPRESELTTSKTCPCFCASPRHGSCLGQTTSARSSAAPS